MNQTIGARSHATLRYELRPDENFDPRQFGLIINVRYIDISNEKLHMGEAYNGTVSVTDSLDAFDAETGFLYLSLVAILGLVVFAAKQLCSSPASNKGKRPIKKRVEMGTGAAVDNSDFIPNDVKKSLAGKK